MLQRLLRAVSIKARLFLLVSFVLLIMVGLSGFLVKGLQDQKAASDLLYEKGALGLELAYRARVDGQESILGLYRSLNSSPAKVSENVDLMMANAVKVKKDIEEYRLTITDDTNKQAMADELESTYKGWLVQIEKLGNQLKAGESAENIRETIVEATPYNVALIKGLGEIVADKDRAMKDLNASMDIAANKIFRVAIISVIIASIVALILGLLVMWSINGPVTKIDMAVRKIADDLDLSFRGDVVGRDEVSSIVTALNLLFDKLEEVLRSVEGVSVKVASQAQTFSAAAEEGNATVEEVKSSLDATEREIDNLASGAEEINAGVEEVAAGAQAAASKSTEVADQVIQARKAGEGGIDAVRIAVSAATKVAEDARTSMSSIKELVDRAKNIQSFVGDIGQIADQTNLLALNAAIEAARAGEHGRGFAVVAEEVRKLAEESNNSANKIAELARAITADLDKVVNVVGTNAEEAGNVLKQAESAESAIQNIIVALNEITSASQEVATVSEEQAASSQEITSTIQSMTGRTHHISEAAMAVQAQMGEVAQISEQIALGSEELTGLADALYKEVSKFKLSHKGESRQLEPVLGKKVSPVLIPSKA